MVKRRVILGGGLAALAVPAWAQGAGPRVALVIGNAAYASAPLPNAANDAREMSAALRGMGFEVIEVRDATRSRTQEAIDQCRTLLQGRGGVGLLYYAGHGVQLDWRNYMVPVDAQLATADDVPRAAVDIQAAIDAFRKAGNRMNILVLDACRDNPFGKVSSGKGLAPLDAPPGTYLAYATAPGHYAEDGGAAEGNGLYTRFLLQELKQPQARIEDVFKRVRLQVRRASQGRQVPWDSSSLEEDFVFATGQAVKVESPRQRESAFNEQKTAWDRIKDSGSAEDLFGYLQAYPNGELSELAQFRLDQLSAVAVRPATVRDRPAALPSGVNRFVLGDLFEYEFQNRLNGQSRRVIWRVTEATDRRVVMSRRLPVFDQMGGLLEDPFGRKEPALVQVPSDLAMGKRWRSSFRNLPNDGPNEACLADYKVTAFEPVETPAGRFDCFRIEFSGEAISPQSTTLWGGRSWVDPVTMVVVRQENQHEVRGVRGRDDVRVLQRMVRVPRG